MKSNIKLKDIAILKTEKSARRKISVNTKCMEQMEK